ncbi:MAG: extracellular solute-binding protein [Rhodobacterales bacterium]|nr:extracellular solute-binding protein [Rhodobacterales bacterium]
MKDTKIQQSAHHTAKAAKAFNRRVLLTRAAAVGTVAAVGPWYVKDAFSSSGEINCIVWTNYLTEDFLKGFTKSTGIKVNVTPLGSNEELINKMKATKGRGFDMITPTLNRKGQWIDLKLTQPWDLNKIPNLANVEPAFVGASQAWTWDGGQHHLPHIWGTEAMSWRTDLWQTEYGKLSLGDLWIPEMKGKIQGRPHSLMAGIGRYLAGIGKLPPFEEAYKNEESMRKIWDGITKFAVEHKPWVKQFWNDHDTQKVGFMQNGVVLGQTWDGPAIELMKDGKPIQYMAPKEGAFAWLDGMSMPIGATNKEQTYELINAVYTVESAADSAIKTGYNGVVKGYANHLDEKSKHAFNTAYPGDALSKLWWWPDEPTWYASVRAEYRDKFVAA